MPQPEWLTKLESEPCTCLTCGECKGTGNVYWFLGKYCGPHHPGDDLANLEPCDSCHNGVIELCDRCAALEDYDTWDREQPDSKIQGKEW
jgi:hypothetical protein